ASLERRLLGEQLLELILARAVVQTAITETGFQRGEFFLHLDELLLKLFGIALVRGQLLAQRGGGLALGALVGLVGLVATGRRGCRGLADAVIDQPTRIVVEVAI